MATKKLTCSDVKLTLDNNNTLIATWVWKHVKDGNELGKEKYTSGYTVRWWYETDTGIKLLGRESNISNPTFMGTYTHSDNYTIPTDSTTIWFSVKPISTKHKVKVGKKQQDKEWYSSDFSTVVTYKKANTLKPIASKPPTPSVIYEEKITEKNIDGQIVYKKKGEIRAEIIGIDTSYMDKKTLDDIKIHWEFVEDNKMMFDTSTSKLLETGVAKSSVVSEVGHEYTVRCRISVTNTKSNGGGRLYSDYSEWSSPVSSGPGQVSKITDFFADSKTSIFLKWKPVKNIDSYIVEYTTDTKYFDFSSQDEPKSVTRTETNAIISGLEQGARYYFRVKAVKNNIDGAYSPVVSVVLGVKPAEPTTWSSTTTAVAGDPLTLFWVHNSKDGSSQVSAEIEYTVNGNTQTITVLNTTDEEERDKTSQYSVDTSAYIEGIQVSWRVRTCGVTGEYSDWSTSRTIDIYGKPTLTIGLVDQNDERIETVKSFPIYLKGRTGPETQQPIGYNVTVISEEAYDTVDYVGNDVIVSAGDTIYSKFFDITEQINNIQNGENDPTGIKFIPDNIDLENNVTYRLICQAVMDSGLTVEQTLSFTVAWKDEIYLIDAEISYDESTYTTNISPYCSDENGVLANDVMLSVFRREFDGTFTELSKHVRNADRMAITDPHPALDYARYRVVATSESTGAVSFFDIPGYYIGCNSVIVQWDEKWSEFDNVADMNDVQWVYPWSGSLLKLSYNIDVSDNNSPDVSLVNYIGRKHPVSYYGTHRGYSSSWSVEIDKEDKDTLYALRRLQNWMGDVYVREPSGSGYWANIRVSFNQEHTKTTIPVTLDIVRVEGGA